MVPPSIKSEPGELKPAKQPLGFSLALGLQVGVETAWRAARSQVGGSWMDMELGKFGEFIVQIGLRVHLTNIILCIIQTFTWINPLCVFFTDKGLLVQMWGSCSLSLFSNIWEKKMSSQTLAWTPRLQTAALCARRQTRLSRVFSNSLAEAGIYASYFWVTCFSTCICCVFSRWTILHLKPFPPVCLLHMVFHQDVPPSIWH